MTQEPVCPYHHRLQPPKGAQNGHLLRTRASQQGPHGTYLGTSSRPPPDLGPCTLSSSPWVPPWAAAVSYPGPWRGSGCHPWEQAYPDPPIFPGERPGSYLCRVSLISCGRDMWHQCPSPDPKSPPPFLSVPTNHTHTHTCMHTELETSPGLSQASSDRETLRNLGCSQPCRPSPIPSTCLEDTEH